MKKGWTETKLGDVCGFQNGFAFKSNTFKPTGYPIIRISNIQDGSIDSDNRLVFFDPKDYSENLDRYRVVEVDLLIAMSGATTGKIGFNTDNTVFYLNQRVGKFEPGANLNKRFLYPTTSDLSRFGITKATDTSFLFHALRLKDSAKSG